MNAETPFEPCATERYSMKSGSLFRFLLLRHCFTVLAVALLIGVVLMVTGFVVDLRIAVLGFMILLILMPLIIAWCWMHYALVPINAFNLLPHSLKFQPDGIEVSVYTKIVDTGDEDVETNRVEEKITKYFYSKDKMTGLELWSGGVFIVVCQDTKPHKTYLYVANSSSDTAVMHNLNLIGRKV